MKYILLSSTCSKNKYDEIYRTRTQPMLDSSQKFFLSLLKGLSLIKGNKVTAITELPVSYNCYKKKNVGRTEDSEGTIRFNYVPFINLPIIKTICVFLQVRKELKRIIKNESGGNITIICDALSLPMSMACNKYRKMKTVQLVCVATDLPMMSVFHIHNPIKMFLYRIYNRLSQFFVTKFDLYVELVDKMDSVINPNKKPRLVMECILSSDYNVSDNKAFNTIPNHCKPRLLYAGKLHIEFGLKLLAESLGYIRNNCELHLYGEGNYKEDLFRLSKVDKRIFVHNAVSVDEILEIEKNSAVLINPRTSDGEFTKYSFPSKTVEYLVTGVPIAMFHLPGIPEEYSPYLNYAEREDAQSLAKVIDSILEDYISARKKAYKGMLFVTSEKNYIRQAQKFDEFMRNHIEGDNFK